jgi:hypothetical protein
MNNEPVAWHYPDGKPDQCTTDKAYAEKDPAWTPMYYKHEWVGLTYEDMVKLQKDLYDAKGESVLPTTFAMAVEAKLKEKNNDR